MARLFAFLVVRVACRFRSCPGWSMNTVVMRAASLHVETHPWSVIKMLSRPPSRPLGCPHLSPGWLRGSFAPWKDGEPSMLVPSNFFSLSLFLSRQLISRFRNPRRIILLVAERACAPIDATRLRDEWKSKQCWDFSRTVFFPSSSLRAAKHCFTPRGCNILGKKGPLFLGEPKTLVFVPWNESGTAIGRSTHVASDSPREIEPLAKRFRHLSSWCTISSFLQIAIRKIYRRVRAMIVAFWCPSLV